MMIVPRVRRQPGHLMLQVSFAACFAFGSIALPPAQVEAGTLLIPAWAFDRGNVEILADPDEYADAGPVVASGPERPWGSTVEYDIDFPVTGKYTLQICYASDESRPVDIFFDNIIQAERCCVGVTFASTSDGKSAEFTANSSGAKWEGLIELPYYTPDRPRLAGLSLARNEFIVSKGKHTLRIFRRGPLPHLVAIRLETEKDFPEEWKPPKYTVKNIDAVAAEYRNSFVEKAAAQMAALPKPLVDVPQGRPSGSIKIPAWTFDRGNIQIHADPDEYADAGPLAGGGPQAPQQAVAEYDIEIPIDGDYTLQMQYASAEARPTEVWFDDNRVGICCNGVTFGSTRYEQPVRLSANSKDAVWSGEHLTISAAKGKHALKLTRRGPLPHLMTLRLETATAFPKDFKQVERKVDLTRVAPLYRRMFLPPLAVNIAALRLAIEDMTANLGPQYPDGPKYLEQLSDLEAKREAALGGTAEEQQKIDDQLAALRDRAMLAHPELKFDKLLFLKRPENGYGHTYADQHAKVAGGNLCVLSPVSPDGSVSSERRATPLVPELDGGLFDRFDISYDAKKVVFSYRKDEEPFRIFEIDIDPAAGKMIPGSLRQLTFGGEAEAEALACQFGGAKRRFHDMDPCYLPNGKIIFASTRTQGIVFCSPGASVTTLHVMDADGKNLRRLSESPVSETAPSMMEDGRVLYTRWEYVDKGLGNGQALWTVRPDGSGVDHFYKNNTIWPAGMSSARGIPGSRKIVTIGGGHHFTAVGTVVLVDARRSRRTAEAMTCLTPELGYPPLYGYPKTRFGTFMDPYPFSEKLFLVSHKLGVKREGGSGYGIYALDSWGNRAEIYRDPKLSCFQATPLRPRPTPTELASLADIKEQTSLADVPEEAKQATLFIQDIYQGMTGIERGRVKYVRVTGALQWPWSENGISWRIGIHADPHRKRIYGIAKVHEDGSCYFKAPANKNLFFQALDENYMVLQHMSTFVNLMPGERRSCVGCHELRRNAPGIAGARPLAMNYPVQPLVPQPGDKGVRMVHYEADVQPALDKHCVGCHSGENAKGRLDLSGVATTRYNRSYENIINRGLVNYRDCMGGRAGFRSVPPLTHGSHRSKLVDRIRKAPCKSNLTQEEFIKIVTWIDVNVPYYGTYHGKRDPKHKDAPDFRPVPLAGK